MYFRQTVFLAPGSSTGAAQIDTWWQYVYTCGRFLFVGMTTSFSFVGTLLYTFGIVVFVVVFYAFL